MRNPSSFPCAVWLAEDWQGIRIGYLVTEPGDIDRPVALVESELGAESDAKPGQPLAVARHIAAGTPSDWWGRGVPVIDLTHYGHPDSRSPMPAFVYNLRCRPLPLADIQGATRDEDKAPPPIHVPAVEPRPYCRFLMAELIDRHNRIHFTAAERGQYPLAAVSLFDQEDGLDGSVNRIIDPVRSVPVGPLTLAKLEAIRGRASREPMTDILAWVVDALTNDTARVEARKALEQAGKGVSLG